MGASQSQEDKEEDEEDIGLPHQSLLKKVLRQEPEVLPCHASASPLSPQPSALGTPRLGPSIKVWDPYNVLSSAPPPLPLPPCIRTVEIYLIAHGECGIDLRPDLVGGRWPTASLTSIGNRQTRALAVFLKSQGVRFNAAYTSPLDRARTTALSVCRELNLPDDQIQLADALIEMSYGQWEGCLQAEIYTPETVNFIDRLQPDFCAPSGESLRQVEFRMIEFLNEITARLQEKPYTSGSSYLNELKGTTHSTTGPTPQHLDLLPKPSSLSKKRSGKSRLQVVRMGGTEMEDECPLSDRDDNHLTSGCSCIGIFTHATPIKCLLTGLLGCSSSALHRLCVDDSSTTVLQQSMGFGWQVKRLNDTSHLRLL